MKNGEGLKDVRKAIKNYNLVKEVKMANKDTLENTDRDLYLEYVQIHQKLVEDHVGRLRAVELEYTLAQNREKKKILAKHPVKEGDIVKDLWSKRYLRVVTITLDEKTGFSYRGHRYRRLKGIFFPVKGLPWATFEHGVKLVAKKGEY